MDICHRKYNRILLLKTPLTHYFSVIVSHYYTYLQQCHRIQLYLVTMVKRILYYGKMEQHDLRTLANVLSTIYKSITPTY